jgi:hypothetical protein
MKLLAFAFILALLAYAIPEHRAPNAGLPIVKAAAPRVGFVCSPVVNPPKVARYKGVTMS